MPLSSLEILIFSVILTGTPGPVECESHGDERVTCSNGVTATADPKLGIVLNGQVTVTPASDGRFTFSNGIWGELTAFGWVRFSNGVEVRHDDLDGRPQAYLVAPNFLCDKVGETKAACRTMPDRL